MGTVLNQGDLLGHTGTTGQVTGDHLHLNVAKGQYAGWEASTGYRQLNNSMHIYDACFVNDTVIINGEGHDWKTYGGPTPPTPPHFGSGDFIVINNMLNYRTKRKRVDIK